MRQNGFERGTVMIKRRQFFQYAGIGGLGWLALHRDLAFAQVMAQRSSSLPKLNTFHFQSVTLNSAGQVAQRADHKAQYFSEDLPNRHKLDMVAITPGQFWMGAHRAESQTQATEFPRHRVTLAAFYMSRYPITQSQWSVIAALPKIRRNLNPEPAHFHGGNRPVESVSWLDAVEFCDRLSQRTGRHYQLPSEAQWEYACRAGTQTPFHTGETITSHLAEYVSTYQYRQEVAGEYQQATVPTGQYLPNAFGLQDMHGNVWEWCLDQWHPNYHRAPTRGQARTISPQHQIRTIRGGGWLDGPASIRSARRSGYRETDLNRTIGFRVVTV